MGGFSLIEKIRSAGFELSLDGSSLLVSPASKLSPGQREFIRSHKAELVTALRLSEVGLVEPCGHDVPASNDDPAQLWTRLYDSAMAVCDLHGDGPNQRSLMVQDLHHIPESEYRCLIGHFEGQLSAYASGSG